MGLFDPACHSDRFDLGKLDFHHPGGGTEYCVPPTQSAVGAAQSTVELPETINMVHRVLFRPPHRVPGVNFCAPAARAEGARRGAPGFFRPRPDRSGRRLNMSFCDFRVQLGRIRRCVPSELAGIRIS